MHISSENKKKTIKVETKNILCFGTRNNLKQPTTTWNDLKRPTRSKKRPESETTYNYLATKRARNDMKRPATGKKQPETTYNEQEMTWNDLERARNDLKQHKTSKKRPKMTYHDLKRPAANKKQPGNDQKRAKNNLKQPTTSKTTYYDPNLLKTSKKKTRNNQQPDLQIILQYGSIGSLL